MVCEICDAAFLILGVFGFMLTVFGIVLMVSKYEINANPSDIIRSATKRSIYVTLLASLLMIVICFVVTHK